MANFSFSAKFCLKLEQLPWISAVISIDCSLPNLSGFCYKIWHCISIGQRCSQEIEYFGEPCANHHCAYVLSCRSHDFLRHQGVWSFSLNGQKTPLVGRHLSLQSIFRSFNFLFNFNFLLCKLLEHWAAKWQNLEIYIFFIEARCQVLVLFRVVYYANFLDIGRKNSVTWEGLSGLSDFLVWDPVQGNCLNFNFSIKLLIGNCISNCQSHVRSWFLMCSGIGDLNWQVRMCCEVLPLCNQLLGCRKFLRKE